MRTEFDAQPARPSILRRLLAGLVLIVVVVMAVHIVVGLVLSVFWLVLGVAAVLAVLWALNTLL